MVSLGVIKLSHRYGDISTNLNLHNILFTNNNFVGMLNPKFLEYHQQIASI